VKDAVFEEAGGEERELHFLADPDRFVGVEEDDGTAKGDVGVLLREQAVGALEVLHEEGDRVAVAADGEGPACVGAAHVVLVDAKVGLVGVLAEDPGDVEVVARDAAIFEGDECGGVEPHVAKRGPVDGAARARGGRSC
jgi:hypothetical protein